MKKIAIQIGITILKLGANFIYCFMKLFPMKTRILMVSRQSDRPTLDFRILEQELKEQNIETIILSKKIQEGVFNKIKYTFYSLRIMYYLATSKLCILDGYCIPVSILKHKKKLRIVQLWHASGAVKKFGYQILDKEEGSNSFIAKLMEMHKNYDYVLAPSDVTKKVFAKAFHIEEEKIIKLGLPRLEYIANPRYDVTEEIYKKNPQLQGKKTIVYIPTFRKKDTNLLKNVLNVQLDEEKYNLIINLHPLDKTEIPERYVIKGYSSFDLIKLADYIITDYSVLSIEASILQKPIFLLLNDIQSYQEDRGLNINLQEELPSFCCENFAEIIDKIEEKEYNMEELKNYQNRYIEIDPNTTIGILVKFLLTLLREENK